MGVVEHIHIADVKGAPMRSIDTVSALRGIGLAGDRYAIGAGFWHDSKVARDRTLIESEAIEEFERVDRVVLRPGEARRNLTTRGVELNALVGRAFWVGNALCRGTHLCKPCRHLEEVTGKRLLRSLVHRGGLREETGLVGANPRPVGMTVDGFADSRAVFRTTFVRLDAGGDEPVAREPEKTPRWHWFDWQELPQPLFAPVASLVVAGYRPHTVF